MVVIFSEAYLSRLWCTYELATFCKLMRDNPSSGRKIVFLSLSWGAWYNPLNVVRAPTLSTTEHALLANYSCSAAQVYSRRDKARVLGLIREAWGGEDVFDDFVHKELPEVLLEGKRSYFSQFKYALWASLMLLFG